MPGLCLLCVPLLQRGPPHARIDQEDVARGDDDRARHDEVVEGGVVPGLDAETRLVLHDPGVGLPVDGVPHQNQRRPLQLAAGVDESLGYNGIRGEGFLGVEI